MNKLIVLNHKMSLLYDEVYNYIDITNNIETDNDIIICPSSIYLEVFVNNSVWTIGAQNMHFSTDERHTGEISSLQLKSLGVIYSLIGHYERVNEFNENGSIVNEKLIAALDSNIVPILCFGENIDEDYKDVLPKTLDRYLKDIVNIDFIIFAYEPIYAIGSGTTPSKDKIKEIVSFIHDYLYRKFGKRGTVLYGGSVDSSNISDILSIEDVDGVLVGNISSNGMEVQRMINSL